MGSSELRPKSGTLLTKKRETLKISGLRRSAPVRAGLRRSAPVCAGLRRSAPVRAGLRRSILKIFVNRKFRFFIKKLSSGESRIVFSKEEPRTQRSFLERNARER